MPAGPVGSVWASGSWSATVWLAGAWGDVGEDTVVVVAPPWMLNTHGVAQTAVLASASVPAALALNTRGVIAALTLNTGGIGAGS